MSIIDQLPDGKYPFAVCLISTDCMTTSGIAHRVLEDIVIFCFGIWKMLYKGIILVQRHYNAIWI
jgi:hypothetical protein